MSMMSRAAAARTAAAATAVTKTHHPLHPRGVATAAVSSSVSSSSSSFQLMGAAWTRAFRCIWMLEELGIPYQILDDCDPGSEQVKKYNPSGKVPVLLEYNNNNNNNNDKQDDDDGDNEPSFILTESTAINTYLGDCFPTSGLVPSVATATATATATVAAVRADRARYNAIISYISNELDSQALWAFRKHVSMGQHFGYVPEMEHVARAHFVKANAVVAQQLLHNNTNSTTPSSSSRSTTGGSPSSSLSSTGGSKNSSNNYSISNSSTGPYHYLLGPHFTAADILYIHCLDWAKGLKWHDTWPPHLHAYRQRCHERPAYQRTKALRDEMQQKQKQEQQKRNNQNMNTEENNDSDNTSTSPSSRL